MAQVNQRLWKIPGQRTKRKAWGFTAQINGKQVRRYTAAEWTQDDAEAELAKVLLQIEPERPKCPSVTFDQAIERYLAAKSRKRSVSEDGRILGHLKDYFGKDTPLAEITASRVSEYKGHPFRPRGRSAKARVPSSARLRERRSTAHWPCCGTCFVSHTRSGSYSTRCPGSGWSARQKVDCVG
jgi:hypothetical protein